MFENNVSLLSQCSITTKAGNIRGIGPAFGHSVKPLGSRKIGKPMARPFTYGKTKKYTENFGLVQ